MEPGKDDDDVELGQASEHTLNPDTKSVLFDAAQEMSSMQKGTHTTPSAPVATTPLERLAAYGVKFRERAHGRFEETYPIAVDMLWRIGKLLGLTLVTIFVVCLASWIMAITHWFIIVLGHIVLRYVIPESIDDAYATGQLDNTMIFAGVGAFAVNLPPFLIFLLSFPITFDRRVLEASSSPANDFIKRITPKNRHALTFMKYAPRLLAGPIGCAIFWFASGSDAPYVKALDPLHAFFAGVAGDATLSGIGYVRNLFKRKPGVSGPVASTDPSTNDSLPL